MSGNSNKKLPPKPPPLPPHPKQAHLIEEENLQSFQPTNSPKIKYKSTFSSNNSFLNSSPISRLNIGKKNIHKSIEKLDNLKKSEKLIEANYLKKILSKEALNESYQANRINELNELNQDNLDGFGKNVDYKYMNEKNSEVPQCCYAPPFINYINGCKEIKKKINYGKRIQIIDPTTCNHYLIGNECERCCKLTTINRNVLSLHCAWHHQLLTCFVCKMKISDLEQHVYKGKVFCEECFNRTKKLHASELRTIHKKN